MLKRNADILLFLLNLNLALAPPPPGESIDEYPRLSILSAVTSIKNLVSASYKLLEVKSLAENVSNWFGYGIQGKTSESDLLVYTSDGNIFVNTNDNERKRKEDEIIAAEFAPDCDIPAYPDYIVTPPPDTVNGRRESDFYFEESEKISPNDNKNNKGQENFENSNDNNNGNTDNLKTDSSEMKTQNNIEISNVEELKDNERVNTLINYEEKDSQGKQVIKTEDLIETIVEEMDLKKSTNESDPYEKEAEYDTDKNTPEFIPGSKPNISNENDKNSREEDVSNGNNLRQKHSNVLDLKDSVQEIKQNIESDGENKRKESKEIDNSPQNKNLAEVTVKEQIDQKKEQEMDFNNGKTLKDTKIKGSGTEFDDTKFSEVNPTKETFYERGDIDQSKGPENLSANNNIQKNTDETPEKPEKLPEENDYANKIELTQKFLSEERKALAREKMSDFMSKSDKDNGVNQTYLANKSNKISEKESSDSVTNKRRINERQEFIDIKENIPDNIADGFKQTDDVSHKTEILDESNLVNGVVKQVNKNTSKHKIIKKNLNLKNYENESNTINKDIKLVEEKIRKTENEINLKEKEIIDDLANLNIDPESIKKYVKKFRKENALMKNKKGKEKDITIIDIFEKISSMMEKKKKNKKSVIREEDL